MIVLRHTRALITPPSADVVSLAEAKAHLRIDTDEDDELVADCVAAAVHEIDPAYGGWLGRALRSQQWEYRIDAFPPGVIELPYPPLVSVDAFSYVDDDGVTRTLSVGTGYRVVGDGSNGRQALMPPYNESWPTARRDPESVTVRYTCGYAGSPDDLPRPIKAWVMLRAGTYYRFREDVTVAGAAPTMLPQAMTMLAPWRVW